MEGDGRRLLEAGWDVDVKMVPGALRGIKDTLIRCRNDRLCRFDFEDPSALNYDGFAQVATEALVDARAQALLMWWDLDMDGTGQLILSTKPSWDKKKQTQVREEGYGLLRGLLYLRIDFVD